MKKVKKQVHLEVDEISMTRYPNDDINISSARIRGYGNIEFHKLEYFIEVDEPETIKEFLEMHNLTKPELVEWLNKNYK